MESFDKKISEVSKKENEESDNIREFSEMIKRTLDSNTDKIGRASCRERV